MYTNSRFAVAVHTLVYLAMRQDRDAVTSAMFAKSVNTNSVVIRRILGNLHKARLVSSRAGSGGGWALTRPPNKITLCEIYRAVEQGVVFALPQRAANPHCPVGKHMQLILDSYFKEAEQALEGRLAKVTLADVVSDVRAHAQGVKGMARTEDVQRRRQGRAPRTR